MSQQQRDVVRAWQRGAPKSAGNLVTAGGKLYSYRLLIGTCSFAGRTVAYDYTAKGGNHISMTTSKHVGLAKEVADVVMPPPTAGEKGEGS